MSGGISLFAASLFFAFNLFAESPPNLSPPLEAGIQAADLPASSIEATTPNVAVEGSGSGNAPPPVSEPLTPVKGEPVDLDKLKIQLLQLSYSDIDSAFAAFRALGIGTVFIDGVLREKTISFGNLPLIIRLPGPDDKYTGLVGRQLAGDPAANNAPAVQNSFGLSIVPNAATPLVSDTVTTPPAQMAVMYDPDYPEQLAKVRKTLHDIIDRPARQVYIEGMVLEVTRDGLEELGIQWDQVIGNNLFTIGALAAGVPGAKTLSYIYDSNAKNMTGYSQNYVFKLKALVRDGKAEVLSRPSVLTLDNRQATIRVGTDIPIATSKSSNSDSNNVSFNFSYLPTGILLNLRPRISSDGNEVGMIIDTTVSSTMPGADLEIRSGTNNQVLASAPTIATRRVQTYARIQNNTPLIIGGLVSSSDSKSHDKVPVLSNIPLLGNLFKARQDQKSKREVIIVLTPYVLAETQSISKIHPRDIDGYDSFNSELFRDTYRLRSEDVIDSHYIRANKRLTTYRSLVERVTRQNPHLKIPVFESIKEGRVPGEDVLVSGMIYDLLKQQKRGEEIVPDRITLFHSKEGQAGTIISLADLLQTYSKDAGAFFKDNAGQALALTFVDTQASYQPGESILTETTPLISIVPCKDRNQWQNLMWEMNTPLPDGRKRHTIVLQEPQDFARLSRAITLKRLVSVNGGDSRLTLKNYLVGRVISFPGFKTDQNHILDYRIARFYFHSVHYFHDFEDKMEQTLNKIDQALRSPSFATIVDEKELLSGKRPDDTVVK